jgi:hypothetical protein
MPRVYLTYQREVRLITDDSVVLLSTSTPPLVDRMTSDTL